VKRDGEAGKLDLGLEVKLRQSQRWRGIDRSAGSCMAMHREQMKTEQNN